MPHERFFIDQPLQTEETVLLEGNEFHHLHHVIRMKAGESVELVNGKNQLATATIVDISRHSAKLLISDLFEEKKEKPTIILAQAIPRLPRLEYILEKGTELGASQFWLFPGIGSEREHFTENKKLRMEQITTSAMKQCGRLDLPPILLKPPLLEWKPLPGTLLFGDTSPTAPPLASLCSQLSSPLVFFIGPEKGFDPKEVSFLKETLSAQGVRLHDHILRVDTAAIAALAITAQIN